MATTDRDALAEVLAAHEAIGWVDGWTCACGIDVGLPPEHQVHLADAILASDWLAQRDRRVAAEALREALDPQEDPDMLRAMLLDAADRLANPRHRGNEHAWPRHAAMFRHLADRIEAGDV